LIVTFFPLEYKGVSKAPSLGTHQVFNYSKKKKTKNKEDMWLELERGLELFFQIFWNKLSFILFLCFLHCAFTSDFQRTFAILQFVHPITQQELNLVKGWEENIEKCWMIGTGWVMGGFTQPTLWSQQPNGKKTNCGNS
jgi:hypothetical protein